MRSQFLSRMLLVALSAGFAGLAHAQTTEPMADPTAPTDPSAPAGDPMSPAGNTSDMSAGTPELTPITLGSGRIRITVPIVINLSADLVAKPVNVPLDVYYGVNDDLTVGLTHSQGVVQATSHYPIGAGVCLGGEDRLCEKVYNNLGLDAIYRFLPGTVQVAAHGGLDFLRLSDPNQLALRLGVLVQAPLASRLAIIADPRITIGLTNRDEGFGNKEYLSIPIGVQFWALDQLRLAVRTVFAGPLDGFGDSFTGSLGLFGGFAINDLVEAFAAFDFANIYGKENSADARVLLIGANINL